MRDQALLVCNAHAGERDVFAGSECVDVDALADAHDLQGRELDCKDTAIGSSSPLPLAGEVEWPSRARLARVRKKENSAQ
jgi:hypothetical protein